MTAPWKSIRHDERKLALAVIRSLAAAVRGLEHSTTLDQEDD